MDKKTEENYMYEIVRKYFVSKKQIEEKIKQFKKLEKKAKKEKNFSFFSYELQRSTLELLLKGELLETQDIPLLQAKEYKHPEKLPKIIVNHIGTPRKTRKK